MHRPLFRALLPVAALLASGTPALADDGHGHHAGEDGRAAISLSAEEKHFLLSEMRQFLAVTQRILQANIDGDMPAVAEAARSVGLAAHRADFANQDSVVHRIRKKAPPAFLPLGRATHAAFDEIADIATEFGDRDIVQRRLAENLGRCVACHATYRIVDAP
jgi:hypothetical protein